MADDHVVIDGTVYPDELSAVALNHPYLPPELKQMFKPQEEEKPDYNYDAWKKANPNVEMAPGQHYPDTYKYPNHMTFSDESIYNGVDGNQGGHWGTDASGGDTFTPGPTNLQMHTPQELKDYFARVEPDVKLLLPQEASMIDVGKPMVDLGGGLQEAGKVGDALLGRGMERYQLPPERTARGAVAFVQALGNASQGKEVPTWAYDDKGDLHTSPELIQQAGDVANMLTQVPGAFAGKLADGTLGSFAGVKAAKNMGVLRDLEHAQIQEKLGMHPDKILQGTGFFRGPDNRWRFEIADDKATYDPSWYNQSPKVYKTSNDPFEQIPFDPNEGKTATTLGEVLDHPDLYKAYPELKDMPVVKNDSIPTAHYDANTNEIHIGPESYNDKPTILHEVQHAIQETEGFARGGSAGKLGKDFSLNLESAYKDFVKENKVKMAVINDKYKKKGAMGLSNEDMDYIHYADTVHKKYSEYKAAANPAAYENYMNLAGEVEARNTEARMMLTDEERRSMHPDWTADRTNPIVTDRPALMTPYGTKLDVTSTTSAPEMIKSAALQYKGQLVEGANHGFALADLMDKYGDINMKNVKDGFTTTHGRFISREEAFDIAKARNQINADTLPALTSESKMLLSEDLQ